jgi:hypothetical protein
VSPISASVGATWARIAAENSSMFAAMSRKGTLLSAKASETLPTIVFRRCGSSSSTV